MFGENLDESGQKGTYISTHLLWLATIITFLASSNLLERHSPNKCEGFLADHTVRHEDPQETAFLLNGCFLIQARCRFREFDTSLDFIRNGAAVCLVVRELVFQCPSFTEEGCFPFFEHRFVNRLVKIGISHAVQTLGYLLGPDFNRLDRCLTIFCPR